MKDMIFRRDMLIEEAEHLEMYDERDKAAMMEMIKSCPAEPQKQSYHFHLTDDSSFDASCDLSFKEAILELAEYTDTDTELFRKCLMGFDECDFAGMVDLYDHFAYEVIEKVYVIGDVV